MSINYERKNIEFDSDGIKLRGWLYLPKESKKLYPAIVMAHGFSAVKEMYLDKYAEVFSSAGFAVLVYDNRNFGESEGTPRQEIDPWSQVRDYRNAITFLRTLPDIDKNRIGIWGTSYSGGHVLVVGAIDKRVKCVVSQVPLVSGYENIKRLVRYDLLQELRKMFDEDREQRYLGKPPKTIPVVCKEPTEICALPTRDAYEWFIETARTRAPNWKNEVTLRSVEMLSEYEPITYVERISPTPVLMIVAAYDYLTPTDLALKAYQQMLDPKKLVILNGGHFDAYVKQFEASSTAAREWFVENLIK